MNVILAGHTVDREQLRELQEGRVPPGGVTPETIPAAYARISRSPLTVTELREAARRDVEESRRSNRIIVFGMGHHSVAEHVQLSFDVLGVSRLALEALEESRLASYTEKSQRYVTFEGGFVTPEELSPSERELLERTSERQFSLYRAALAVLHEHQMHRNPGMLGTKRDRETVEGWAKEDARYALGLSTSSQLGFSANARNVEHAIRKLRQHTLAEARELSRRLFDAAAAVAPSLIVLSDPARFKETFGREVSDAHLARFPAARAAAARAALAGVPPDGSGAPPGGRMVRLVGHTPEPDVKAAACLLAAGSGRPWDDCLRAARALAAAGGIGALVAAVLDSMTEFDAAPRELECVSFTFEIVLSAACFGQLKRHRMMTILPQGYDPRLGITVPAAIDETGQRRALEELADASAEAWEQVRAKRGEAVAAYFLTNAHRRRAIVECNLRELYHVARLRMDPHAQWDIRDVAGRMVRAAREVAPAAAALACGKHELAELKKAIEGMP